MTTQWRLFLTALRFDTRLPAAALRGAHVEYPGAAARYFPVAGALVGAIGGAVFWLATLLWPASIAVVLSMLATTTMSGGTQEIAGAEQRAPGSTRKGTEHAHGVVAFVFALLLKFNALMALSAASLPFAVPANAALGLIMICGHAAGCALIISLIASPTGAASHAGVASPPITNVDLSVALAVGFAPAALLGLPGLVGLAAAILARVGYGAYLKRGRRTVMGAELYAAQQLCEICFYLGAVASWAYV
jgi:adenosylcobinamide-GDP ribazoletransferase